MDKDQLIELLWDGEIPLDQSRVDRVRKGGFAIRRVNLKASFLSSIDSARAPTQVVCLGSQGRDEDQKRIRALKESFGAQVYIILLVSPVDLNSAIFGVRNGVDDIVSLDATAQEWERVAASARIRLLKFESLVFVDQNSQDLLALVERVGGSDVTVLLQGATGSGKEVLARLTHDFSSRREGAFVPVNCAALPESLAESLLFGHLKGSFTGATRTTDGFFKQAQHGTLFLDEVGELSPQLQAKLLRAIQEKEVLPVGASSPIKVDVRIVSATNRDLREMIASKDFREDLYFRLSTFKIKVPDLQARADDIIPLANFFALKYAPESQTFRFDGEAIAKLLGYRWPGNVRELENVVQRALVLARDESILAADLIFDESPSPPSAASTESRNRMQTDLHYMSVESYESEIGVLQDNLEANEFRIIAETVRNSATKQEAARQLGISDRTLRYKLAKMRERGLMPRRASA